MTAFAPGDRVRVVASSPTFERADGRTGETGTVVAIKDNPALSYPIWVRHDRDGTRLLYAPGALEPITS